MLFKRKIQPESQELTQKEIEKPYGPIGSTNAPPPQVIAARQQPQFVVDPREVTVKDDVRVRLWAAGIMGKHESKMSDKCKENAIIASGDVEPEEVDIRNIYPFKDMHWIIYRKDGTIAYNKKTGDFVRNSKMPKQILFHLLLICKAPRAGNLIKLCDVAFAKI